MRHAFCILLAVIWLLPAQARAESEYDVKAAYLFNFTRLVKWPASAFASPQAPLVIGVVGRDPFNGGLDGTLRGQKAGVRPIEVRHVSAGDAAALQTCHLIYVTAADRFPEVARAVQGHPVLAVGDAENFARNGGIIGFVTRDRKIKLEINNDAARQLRLSIPSDLLGIATIVN